LSAPIFIAMMALAPQVVRLLYSASFSPAVEVLRWQILGDVLKIASWPLGFVILAAGDGKSFFWTETVTWLLAVAFVIFLLPTFGLNTTGLAWVVVYACYLPLVYTLAKSRIGFRWSRMSVQSFLISFVACASVQALSAAKYWGPISSFIAIVATASWAPIRIRSISRGRETH
jgi:O-antigen/teichoic acid export membrane protein